MPCRSANLRPISKDVDPIRARIGEGVDHVYRIVNNELSSGFSEPAWPARYVRTLICTFQVRSYSTHANQDGRELDKTVLRLTDAPLSCYVADE